MVKKLSFTVPMASLRADDSGKRNIEIGSVGRSKWFLYFSFESDNPNIYWLKTPCLYRFVLDEFSKQEFNVCLYNNFELLEQEKFTSDLSVHTFEEDYPMRSNSELKGSITLLDNPERISEEDSEACSDEDEIDSNSESDLQSEEETKNNCCSSAQLMDDLSRLLVNPDIFSDATLECGSDTIPCHKNILSVRSPVFAAMFQQKEMREGRDGKVVVDDIRPDVMRAMLKYIYTGKSDHVAADSMAGDLLFAADKYQLQELKSICVGKLRSNMAASNVLRNLVLGDLHDGGLKACAIEFICKNKKMSKLKKSEDWMSLQKERPELAMEVLSSMVEYLQRSTKQDI